MLVITGCNADASAGLFRQLANAREVVDVRYNQLLGQKSVAPNDLYFLTDTGVHATAGLTTTTSRILENKKDNLIRSANYDKNDTIFYTINEEPAKVQKYIISTDTKSTPAIVHGTISTIISVKVIPNGLILLTGTNSSGATTYALLDSTLAEVSNLSSINLDGYSLSGVLQQTGFGSASIAASPMVVSFVSGSTYKHYYIPITAPAASEINVDNEKRVVNFFESGTVLYLLTSDGMIFKGDTTSLSTAFTEIHDATETYPDYAFGYFVDSSPTLHYITKPNNKDQLTVFSINTATDAVTTTTVTKGYAKLIYNTEIVDALRLTSGDLLVATARNGMYRITITTPNSNDDSNGSSTEAEKYFP